MDELFLNDAVDDYVEEEAEDIEAAVEELLGYDNNDIDIVAEITDEDVENYPDEEGELEEYSEDDVLDGPSTDEIIYYPSYRDDYYDGGYDESDDIEDYSDEEYDD